MMNVSFANFDPFNVSLLKKKIYIYIYALFTEQNYKCNTFVFAHIFQSQGPTLCGVIKLHILEWPFIVASLRHTCAIIMQSNQHLEMPHMWGGWII